MQLFIFSNYLIKAQLFRCRHYWKYFEVYHKIGNFSRDCSKRHLDKMIISYFSAHLEHFSYHSKLAWSWLRRVIFCLFLNSSNLLIHRFQVVNVKIEKLQSVRITNIKQAADERVSWRALIIDLLLLAWER